jgi:hypothetical protein
MNNITDQEKVQSIMKFHKKQQRNYMVGKIIVITIATINALLSLMSFFIDFDYISLVIQIILIIALLYGVVWVRYLFAIGSMFSVYFMLKLLTNGFTVMFTSAYIIIFAVLFLTYSIISCILLFTSKSVSTFLYKQKNG